MKKMIKWVLLLVLACSMPAFAAPAVHVGDPVTIENDHLGSIAVCIEGFGRFPYFDNEGRECFSLRCIVENLSETDEIWYGFLGGEYICLTDENGFSCESYSVATSKSDGIYQIGENVAVGEKRRLAVLYYSIPGSDRFTVDLGNGRTISFIKGRDGFEEVVDVSSAEISASGTDTDQQKKPSGSGSSESSHLNEIEREIKDLQSQISLMVERLDSLQLELDELKLHLDDNP